MATTKPTLFAPVAPQARSNRHRHDNWQALFLPIEELSVTDSENDPVLSLYPILCPTAGKRPKSVKRRLPRTEAKVVSKPSEPRNSTNTLQEYLVRNFLQKPVSIYTQAGRIQGTVEEVSSETVLLATNEGQRSIDLHAIFSVAHQLPPR